MQIKIQRADIFFQEKVGLKILKCFTLPVKVRFVELYSSEMEFLKVGLLLLPLK